MNLVSHSPPVRVSATGKPLAFIPAEIYLSIFVFVDELRQNSTKRSKNIFCSLSLVCRYFALLALARIYNALVIVNNSPRPLVHFFGRLADNDSVALYLSSFVKEITFLTRCSGRSRPRKPRTLDRYHSTLSRFSNLTTVALQSYHLPRLALQNILELPRLTSLSLHGCVMDDTLSLELSRSPELSHLSISHHGSRELPTGFSEQIDLGRLESFQWESSHPPWKFPQGNRLHSLHLASGLKCITHQLLETLDSVPQLECLRLHSFSLEGTVLEASYQRLVPRLRSISVSLPCLPILPSLMRGRPITEISVLGVSDQMSSQLYQVISQGHATILERMVFPCSFVLLLAQNGIQLENLRSLCIIVPNCDTWHMECLRVVSALSTASKCYPKLRHLGICVPLDEDLSDSVCQELPDAIPSLITIEVTNIPPTPL